MNGSTEKMKPFSKKEHWMKSAIQYDLLKVTKIMIFLNFLLGCRNTVKTEHYNVVRFC